MSETSSSFFLITADYIPRKPNPSSGLFEEPGVLFVLRNCVTLNKIYYFLPLNKIPRPCFYVTGIANKDACLWEYQQFMSGVDLSSLSENGNYTKEEAIRWLSTKSIISNEEYINAQRVKPYIEEGPAHFYWRSKTYKFSFDYPAQLTSFIALLRKKRIVTLEADMSRPSKFALKVLIDYGIKSGVKIPSLEPFDIEKRNYRIWFLDIETLAGWGKVSVEKVDEPIIVIGFYDNYDKKYYMLYWMEYGRTLGWTPPEDAVMVKCRNEQEMLEKLCEMAKDKDPDIITAYNLYGFDFPKIIARMTKYRMNKNALSHPATQCRMLSNHSAVYPSEGGMYKVLGRVLFDMLVGYKDLSGGELKEYTLEYVIKEEKLPIEKIQVDLSFMETWQQCPEVIFQRNYNDQKAMVLLEEKCGVIEYYEEISKFVGLPLDKCISPVKLQRKAVIDTQMLRQFHGLYVFPSERDFMRDLRYSASSTSFDFQATKKTFKGATVLEPKPNMWNWVFVFDFKEMYPSIIYAFNISPDTINKGGKMIVDENHRFYDKGVREGTMPQVIKYFRAKRNEYKLLMKNAVNEDEKIKYSRREKSVKACTNACFLPGTDVLTRDGFKKIEEMKIGDHVYTYDKNTNIIVDDKVVETQTYDYTGIIHHLNSKNMDLSVTDYHRFFVKDQNTMKPKVIFSQELCRQIIPQTSGVNLKGRNYFKNNEKIDITNFITSPIKIVNKKIKNGVYIAGKLNKGHFVPRFYEPEDFIEFLSWYVTEGSILEFKNKETARIQISQKKFSNEIKILLEKMNIPYKINFDKRSGTNNYCISSKPLANSLINLCGNGSYNKKMPSWILDLNKYYLNIVWSTMIKGDGDFKRPRYSTVSEKLANFFLTLTLLIGKCPIKKYDKNIYRITWETHTLGRRLRPSQIQRNQYEGKVHCITAERNHFIYAGNNGKMILTSQCYGVMDLDSFRLCRRNNEGENEVTSAITMVGRELIAYIGKRATEDPSGLDIIYGDTDSLFLTSQNLVIDKTNFQEVANMLQLKVTGYLEDWERSRGLATGNFRIDLDKVFEKMWLRETKKRYVGEMIFKDKLIDPPEKKVVGWGRSDVSDVQEKIFELITEKQFTGKDTMPEIGELLLKVRKGEVELLEIATTKSLSMNLVKKATAIKHNTKVGKFEILNYGKLKVVAKDMKRIVTTKGQYTVKDSEEKIDSVPSHVKAVLYSNKYLGTYYDSGMKVYIVKINEEKLNKLSDPMYPSEANFKFHMNYNESAKKKEEAKVDENGVKYEDKDTLIVSKKRKRSKSAAFTPYPIPLIFKVQAIAFDQWTKLPDQIMKAIDWEQEYQDLHKLLCDWLKVEKLNLPVEALDIPKASRRIEQAKVRREKMEKSQDMSVFKTQRPVKEQTSFEWARGR